MFLVDQMCINGTAFNWAYRYHMMRVAGDDVDSFITCLYGA